ncbi:MAG: S-layer homology domain-containing protein [Patescibacteria group bacterium]
MSNKKFTLMLLIPMILSSTLTAFAENFSDVKTGNKYFVSVNYLKEFGFVTGYEDNSFKPSQNVVRAEALKMIMGASSVIPAAVTTDTTTIFTDVPQDAWYKNYLAEALNLGIINNENTNFRPGDVINLAESLKMYFNTLGDIDYQANGDTTFEDTPNDAWFKAYTSYAGAKGLINIYNNNTINPNQDMTRGYLAEIIYRQIKTREGYNFGKATYYFGIPGKANDSYDQSLMVTAHKTLPMGTIVEVTNMSTGKSINVKVTDRGPFGPGRVLDLSNNAFSALGDLSAGVMTVQYKVL